MFCCKRAALHREAYRLVLSDPAQHACPQHHLTLTQLTAILLLQARGQRSRSTCCCLQSTGLLAMLLSVQDNPLRVSLIHLRGTPESFG